MPKVAYSEEDRERIRAALVTEALERMARQGIQHTTVEQIYKAVGISRTFFLIIRVAVLIHHGNAFACIYRPRRYQESCLVLIGANVGKERSTGH